MNNDIEWQKPLREIAPQIVGMEAGGTPQLVEATNLIVRVLAGFPAILALSCLTNATAVVLAEICKTETRAVDETRGVRREIERCLRVNAELQRKARK